MESSMSDPGKFTSFTEYIDRAPEDQDGIYYLVGASREVIEMALILRHLKQED